MKTRRRQFLKTGWVCSAFAILACAPFTVHAVDTATTIWNGGTTAWATGSNWSAGTPDADTVAEFSTTFTNQPAYSGTTLASGLWLATGVGQDVDITAGIGALTLTGTGTINGNANTAILLDDTANHSLSIPGTNPVVTLANDTRFLVNNAGTLTIFKTNLDGKTLTLGGTNALGNIAFTHIIGTTNTAGSIIVDTAGTVTLSAANVFTGGLTLTNGTLKATTSAANLGAGTLTLGGGSLQFADSAARSYNRNTTVTGNTQIVSDLNASGAGVTYTLGTLSIGAQTLNIAKGDNVDSGTAGVTFGATTLTGNTIFNTGASTLLTLGAVGDGAAAKTITKNGAGTLALNSAATSLVSGSQLNVKEGTLSLGNATAAGAGTITLGDSSGTATATLMVTTGSATIANAIALNSGGTLALVTNGTNNIAFSGGITGNNDLSLNSNNVSGGALSVSGLINNSGEILINGTGTQNTLITGGIGANVTGVTQNSATSSVTIQTTALTVNGTGTTLTNNGGRSFTVSAAVNGTGNLILENNSSLASGITLSGGVNHTGTITNSGTGTTTPAIIGTTNLSYDKNVLISGAIGSGVTTVTQNSPTSVMELSAANAFSGSARVFAGTLILGNATAASTSQILLGDTSGSAAASLLTRGAVTVANNILVQANSSGSATIGAAAGGVGGSNSAPTYSGTITLNKDVTATPFNNNLTFSGLVTGAGGLIVSNAGPYFSTSGHYYGVGGGNVILSKAGLDNTFSGDVRINSGTLTLKSASSTPTSLNGLLGTGTSAILVGDTSGANAARLLLDVQDAQALSRGIIVQAGSGGAVGVGMATAKQAIFSGGITFNQSAYLFNTTTSGATITYSGAITEGSSASGGTSLTTSGGNVSKLTNTGNNYDGGSIVSGVGTLWGSGAGTLGSGNVVAELGLIRLSDQVALASGKKVYTGPYGGVSIGTNSAAQIAYVASVLDSSSQGGVTMGIGLSNTINLASFGNGLMYLGTDSTGLTYSASTLGANTDGNYRLGWGRSTLTLNTTALTGAGAKLIVGTPGALTSVSSGAMNNSGTVSLTNTNTYGGGTEVNTGSSLFGTQRTVAGESPFGSATGAMALHSATLRLQNNSTSAIGTSVGALGFDGFSTIQVDGITGGGNVLTVGEITRNNRGVLSIVTSGTGASYGSTVKLMTSGTAPATTTAKVTGGVDVQMAAPYFIEGGTGSFLSYDATNGFKPITTGYNTTDFSALPTNAIVRMTNQTTTLNANTTIYALGLVPAATQTITSNTSGSDKTLTITSGGIYMDGRTGNSQSATIGNNTANQRISFDFNGQEAIINVSSSNNSALTIAGNIVNANGLTKSGNAQLTLSGTGSTFTGPITVLGSTSGLSTLAISNDLNLGGSGAALNNGVVLDGGKLLFASPITMNINRTLTIGANGGALTSLTSGNYGASAVTIDSKITGTGGNLTVYSNMTGGSSNTVTSSFAFTNTANDFTAPIFIGNTAQSGVMALLFDTDSQLGNTANKVSLLGGNSALRYTGSGAISSARGINFFDLGGGLEVSSATGVWTNSGVLAGSGLFNKMGAGKMVLTGSNTYTGNTIVSAGVLNAQHANALGTTTAAITGNSGVSGGAVYVQSGAALEVQNAGALSGTGGKTLFLNGTGIGNAGALRNVSGNNSNTGAVILQSNTTIGTDAGSLALSGAVSGPGKALTKVGSGTLVLSGANTYTGGTTVSAGTLLVNNSTGSGTGSGALSIGASATLGGSGFIGGATTIAGTLSPGNSPGTLTFDDTLTWVDGGHYNWQVVDATGLAGTGFDTVVITSGGLDLDGLTTFNINLWSLASIGPDVDGDATNFDNSINQSWTLVSGTGDLTGIVGSIFNVNVAANNGTAGFSNDLGGGSFSVVGTTNSLDLVFIAGSVIPEPSTYAALAAFAALGFAALRRRRARQQ